MQGAQRQITTLIFNDEKKITEDLKYSSTLEDLEDLMYNI